jgi:iron complex outermembrane receptor protein
MPANRLSNEVTYNIKDSKLFSSSYVSLEVSNVMEQKNVPSDINGKQDYKSPPPAYTLISCNAATTTTIGKTPVTLSIGVRNMFNTVYRDYLNSMRYFSDEMGRNINLRLKIKL